MGMEACDAANRPVYQKSARSTPAPIQGSANALVVQEYSLKQRRIEKEDVLYLTLSAQNKQAPEK